MVSQVTIWDFLNMPRPQYSLLSAGQKAAMLKKYYAKNLITYYGECKIFFLMCLCSFFCLAIGTYVLSCFETFFFFALGRQPNEQND